MGAGDVARRTLEREGWAVTEATNGQEALARVADRSPDVILLDLMMPVMDGFEFLRELRDHEEWRSIPVVVLTAKELTAADRLQLQGSVESIVQKGANSREELVARIRAVAAERSRQTVRSS